LIEMPVALAIFIVVLATVSEAWLFFLTTHHQASGWGDNPFGAFILLCGLASAPAVLAIYILFRSSFESRVPWSVCRPLAIAALVGPLFSYAALASYGHATPFLLLFAFAGQFSAVAWAWNRRDNTT
jgi:hypothetical protein